MGSIARALAAMAMLCLLASACDTNPVTSPELLRPEQPALDGIGMIGTGGRSAGDGTLSGTTGGAGTDSTTTTSSSGSGSD
jgi:hypothetical protein